MLDSQAILAIKAFVAAAGTGLLAWDLVAIRSGAPAAVVRRRDTLLALLGVVAFLGWWNLGTFHASRFVHVHEFVHYYLGAKYQRELGYTNLYRCLALADDETGGRDVAGRWVRNLETNDLERGERALSQAGVCRERFSASRWQAFKHDVQVFRRRMSDERWRRITSDHGYNASPVWTLAGTLLANLSPSSSAQLLMLALVDPALYVLMWAAVWWTFGWRPMCVALLWWGTNYPARFTWTGGAFLRADWLALLVLGVCLLRQSRPTLAGASLGWSTAVRVFPAVAMIGPAIKWLADPRSWWPRAGLRSVAGLVGGFAVASLAAIVLSSLVNAGRPVDVASWQAFARNSEKHLGQASTNRMGLEVALSFEERTRLVHVRDLWIDSPWDAWYAARERVFERRRWAFWAFVAAYLVLLTLAVRRLAHWEASVLAVGLMAVAFELACYYYSAFLVFGLLWQRHRWVGPALALTSFLSFVPPALLTQADDIYVAESLLTLAFVGVVTVVPVWQAWRATTSDAAIDQVGSHRR